MLSNVGWAQINGRDDISIQEKVQLEKEYMLRKSVWFDIRILMMTFRSVVRSEGVKH